MVKGIILRPPRVRFSTVGIAPVDATIRFAFGNYQSTAASTPCTVLIGMFANRRSREGGGKRQQ
jgi:putative tricarboxylic transport membrane protein